MELTANQVAAVSYALGAGAFGFLAVLMLTAWRGRASGGLLVLATGVTALWCASVSAFALTGLPPYSLTLLLEILRAGAWLLFLTWVLGQAHTDPATRRTLAIVAGSVVALCIVTLVATIAERHASTMLAPDSVSATGSILGHVLLAIGGLALVEQIYRNTRPEQRWTVKFLCFGIGGLFAYDLYLYAQALLFKGLDTELWLARGAVGAIVVPFLAVSARRNPNWSVDVFVSRHVVFYSAAITGAGLYLLLMAAAGYYVRVFGGTWGAVAQAVFLFGSVMLLAALMVSGRVRSEARVFLSKHFYRNQYDYRDEWLRFTQILSTAEQGTDPRETIVRAIATIVESPGGVLWERAGDGDFEPSGSWEAEMPGSAAQPASSSLPGFMERTGWVVYIDEYRGSPEAYPELELPAWVGDISGLWVLVPLIQGDRLAGFVGLNRSSTKRELNWEDSDLLKTVGRQAASYLALLATSEALSDARQFEAFNRLSAYVVHDLKNLVAQLSLVVSNARRHKDSPGFVEDAIRTVDNATGKMNRMLAQLRKGRMETTSSRKSLLEDILHEAVQGRRADAPAPTLHAEGDLPEIDADPDRLVAVLEHLIQNAQDATPADGSVSVHARRDGEMAVVEVRDTGCGMDARFVRNRLFRPFDTTKGNAGMGVGVYESREFVQHLGGRMAVESAPGAGTTIKVFLPLEAAVTDELENDDVGMAS